MSADLPRGIRNKNPGNIDWSAANNWLGQIGIERGVPKPRFCEFDSHENGIRALGKLLQTYFNKRGCTTIRKILVRYAPDFENDTSAYIATVSKRTGLLPDQEIKNIKDPVLLGELMKAIIRHECSNYIYSDIIFKEGLRRALV